MEKVTEQQATDAIAEHGIKRWDIRKCSLCGTPITYEFGGGSITLDTNCACVNYWVSPQEILIGKFIAQTFNLQNPEIREKMWAGFLACGN